MHNLIKKQAGSQTLHFTAVHAGGAVVLEHPLRPIHAAQVLL